MGEAVPYLNILWYQLTPKESGKGYNLLNQWSKESHEPLSPKVNRLLPRLLLTLLRLRTYCSGQHLLVSLDVKKWSLCQNSIFIPTDKHSNGILIFFLCFNIISACDITEAKFYQYWLCPRDLIEKNTKVENLGDSGIYL